MTHLLEEMRVLTKLRHLWPHWKAQRDAQEAQATPDEAQVSPS